MGIMLLRGLFLALALVLQGAHAWTGLRFSLTAPDGISYDNGAQTVRQGNCALEHDPDGRCIQTKGYPGQYPAEWIWCEIRAMVTGTLRVTGQLPYLMVGSNAVPGYDPTANDWMGDGLDGKTMNPAENPTDPNGNIAWSTDGISGPGFRICLDAFVATADDNHTSGASSHVCGF